LKKEFQIKKPAFSTNLLLMMKIVKFVFGYFCIGLVTGRAVVTKIMVTSL